ncbi:MAG: AraC family transcriptional regulator, partial [Chloroflexi bacterium]
MTVRGPETRATPLGDSPSDGEWFGILLKLGTFLPHLPTRSLLDTGVTLPEATDNTFWLSGSAWEFPTSDNAEIFVRRLVHAGLLVRDPVIEAA